MAAARLAARWAEGIVGGSRWAGVEPAAPGLEQRGGGVVSARSLCGRLRRGQVGFGQDQRIGEGRLLARLRVVCQGLWAGDGIHRRNNTGERHPPPQGRVEGEGLNDRCRVGEAGGFDHQPREGDLASGAACEQVRDGAGEVAAHGAAEAAGGERNQVFLRAFQQLMVEADSAELVDDHRRSGERRVR